MTATTVAAFVNNTEMGADYISYVQQAIEQIALINKSENINNKCKSLIVSDIIAQIEINDDIYFNMNNNHVEDGKYNFLSAYDNNDSIGFAEFRYLINEEEIAEIENAISIIYQNM